MQTNERLEIPAWLAPLGVVAISLNIAGCGHRINRPDSAVESYVNAVRNENWRNVYGLLDDAARRSMTVDAFVEYCERNQELMRQQADAIDEALRTSTVGVYAEVPLDTARHVDLTYVGSRWFLQQNLPLLEGGDTPVETLVALAAMLRSDAVQTMLSSLSERQRGALTQELDVLAEALVDGSRASIEVHGTRATVTVGEITIQLLEQDGAWRVDEVSQPYDYYGYYGYYYPW